MESRLIGPVAVALLLAAGTASAAEMQQESTQSSGQSALMRDANMSAQSSTDMSYGGVPESLGAAGAARTVRMRACGSQPQCDVYFGR